MLKSLYLDNFKSWRSAGTIPLAPLTALFGSNSSGKSSLLQMLLLLVQTASSPDRNQVLNLGDENSPVALGTFQEVVHDHELNEMITLGLEWTLHTPYHVLDPAMKSTVLFEGDRLAFYAHILWHNNGDVLGRAIVDRMAYFFAHAEFGMQRAPSNPTKYEMFCEDGDFEFIRSRGRPWDLPPPVKCYGFPDQVRAYFQNAGFLSDFEFKFEQLLGNVYYLGPLRDYPKRQYTWSGAQPSDVGRRGEKFVDALLASREAGKNKSTRRGSPLPSLEKRVARWLKDLGLIVSFELRSITPGGQLFQVWVKQHAGAAEVLITDVGFGVSQILPVITLCYYAPPGSIIILEQPEIHLHPRVQAGLADVFIDAIKRRGVQIILESHSEHLLRRLQRRIAEERLAAEDAALYFCTFARGESHLTSLQLDEFGNITNWPSDFFGDQFGELAATQKARIKRVADSK